ncbi:uncharacterized protein METZ01_LOCUS352937, partial [marine metagenome]
VGSTSEFISNLFKRSLKYFSLQKCLDNLNFHLFGISNLAINKLNISTFPIFKVPDEYGKLDKDFIAVLIISLSSFFSFLEPSISNPI